MSVTAKSNFNNSNADDVFSNDSYRVLYREAHTLINDLADASLDGTRKEQMELFFTVPLLIIDDLGMRKLPGLPPKIYSRS